MTVVYKTYISVYKGRPSITRYIFYCLLHTTVHFTPCSMYLPVPSMPTVPVYQIFIVPRDRAGYSATKLSLLQNLEKYLLKERMAVLFAPFGLFSCSFNSEDISLLAPIWVPVVYKEILACQLHLLTISQLHRLKYFDTNLYHIYTCLVQNCAPLGQLVSLKLCCRILTDIDHSVRPPPTYHIGSTTPACSWFSG